MVKLLYCAVVKFFMEGIRWIFGGIIGRRLGMKMARTAELTAMELTIAVLAHRTSCNIKLCERIEKVSWRKICGGEELCKAIIRNMARVFGRVRGQAAAGLMWRL